MKMAIKNKIKAEEINEYMTLAKKDFAYLENEFNIHLLAGIYYSDDDSSKKKFKYQLNKERDKARIQKILDAGTAIWRIGSDGKWCVVKKGKLLKPGTVIKVERQDGSTSNEIIDNINVVIEDNIYYNVRDRDEYDDPIPSKSGCMGLILAVCMALLVAVLIM